MPSPYRCAEPCASSTSAKRADARRQAKSSDSLLPDDVHRRQADHVLESMRAAHDGTSLFDEVLRMQRYGRPYAYGALAGIRLSAAAGGTPTGFASTGIARATGVRNIPAATARLRTADSVPGHADNPRVRLTEQKDRAFAAHARVQVSTSARVRRAAEKPALQVTQPAAGIANATVDDCDSTDAPRGQCSARVSPARNSTCAADASDAIDEAAPAWCALERSLRTVASDTRMATGERAATLGAIHARMTVPGAASATIERVARAFEQVLERDGARLTGPTHALDSATIRHAQCVRAIQWLITNTAHDDPWHLVGESMVDAADQRLRMAEVRQRVVERIRAIVHVEPAVAEWAATMILSEQQSSLLCSDAPTGLVYGSLEWTDLQIGCEIARAFDVDPGTLDYATLTGLSAALDQDIREGRLDAHWFELGARAAVVFAASRNATAVRAAIERPVVDMLALETHALHVLDDQRRERWQRVNRTLVHLDAFRAAVSEPMPQAGAESWLDAIRLALTEVATDAVHAWVGNNETAAREVDEIDVLDTAIRRPPGPPLSIYENIGLSTIRRRTDIYQSFMRSRAAGPYHEEKAGTTLLRMRRGALVHHYVFDLSSPRGPVIEPVGEDGDSTFAAVVAAQTRLYDARAIADASHGGRLPDSRVRVRGKLVRNRPADAHARAGDTDVNRDHLPLAWRELGSMLAAAFADKLSPQLRVPAMVGPHVPPEAHSPSWLASLFPFVTCIDSIRQGDAASAAFACSLDALSLVPVAGVAASSAATFGKLAARDAFKATLTRTLPAAERRFALGILASGSLKQMRDLVARTAPQVLREAFNVVDPGFGVAWRLISASAHGAPRVLDALRTRARLEPRIAAFRSSPESLRSLYARRPANAVEPVPPIHVDTPVRTRVDEAVEVSTVSIEGTVYPLARTHSGELDASLSIEAPDGLPSAYRLPVELDADRRAGRINERLLGSDAPPPAPEALSPEALRLRVIAQAQVLQAGEQANEFAWGYAREFDRRVLAHDDAHAWPEALRIRFLDASLTAAERGTILRLIDERELAALGAQCRTVQDRLLSDPLSARLFGLGYLGYRGTHLPGFDVGMPEQRLREMFVHDDLSPFQRGALWVRIEQAQQIQAASNAYLDLSFWRRAFEDGAMRADEFVIDAFTQHAESYEGCLRVLAAGQLSPSRLGAVHTRMLGHQRELDAQAAWFHARADAAYVHDQIAYQSAYRAEYMRARADDDRASLAALYERARDPSLTSTELGTLAAHVNRERDRAAMLERDAQRMLLQRAAFAAYVVAGVNTDSLESRWIVEVPGLDARMSEPELARRFVESVATGMFTQEQSARSLERFIVTRNFGRLYRRIDGVAARVDRARFDAGYHNPMATLRAARIDATSLRESADARAFELELARVQPPEVYGALRALLDPRAGDEGALQLGIARFNVVGTQRVHEYLRGYLEHPPIPDVDETSTSAIHALFRSNTLTDRELGSLAARIDDRERDGLVYGTAEIVDSFERVVERAGNPDAIDFVPSMMLPPMFDGILDGPCYPMSLMCALAISRGRVGVDAWFTRLSGLNDLLTQARDERVAQRVPAADAAMPGAGAAPADGADAGAGFSAVEARRAAETIALLSQLQMAQPGGGTELTRGELIVEPSMRAGQWLDVMQTWGRGVWVISTPEHSMVLAIDMAQRLPRYNWFDPNYGMFGYNDRARFYAFLGHAMTDVYGAELRTARDLTLDVWRVDPSQLSTLRMNDDPHDPRTLADFIEGVPPPSPTPMDVALNRTV